MNKSFVISPEARGKVPYSDKRNPLNQLYSSLGKVIVLSKERRADISNSVNNSKITRKNYGSQSRSLPQGVL